MRESLEMMFGVKGVRAQGDIHSLRVLYMYIYIYIYRAFLGDTHSGNLGSGF